MNKTIIIAAIFTFLFINAACAQISIKAGVDKVRLTTDEMLTYKITVTSFDQSIPAPQLPRFDSFDIISQLQSSNISFVKGKSKVTLTYTFALAPKDIGKFKIEPAVIKIENKDYSTETFEIEVTQGKRKPKPEEKLPLPEEPALEAESPQITL